MKAIRKPIQIKQGKICASDASERAPPHGPSEGKGRALTLTHHLVLQDALGFNTRPLPFAEFPSNLFPAPVMSHPQDPQAPFSTPLLDTPAFLFCPSSL